MMKSLKSSLPALLRPVLSALAAALILTPLSAAAYSSDSPDSSNGSDGEFHPIVSTVLDSAREVFNFTDIIIPSGVTVSFSGIASGRQIALLATGIVDISGVLDGGTHSVLIGAPATLSLSGSVYADALTLITAGRIGIADSPAGSAVSASGGTISLGSDQLAPHHDQLLSGGAVNIVSGGISGGNIALSGSGGNILIASPPPRLPIDLGTITAVSAVPEPDGAAMLLAGAGLLLSVVRRRRPGSGLA